MLNLYPAAAKAMASLVGPVAAHAYRRSGQKFFDVLLVEFAEPTRDAEARAGKLSRRLKEAGLSQRELIDLAAFCGTDEGAYCFRLIAINSLAGNALRQEVVAAISTQVAAMIRLHMRDAAYQHAETAAQALVGECASVVIDYATKLKRRDRDLAMELQNLAVDQAQLPDLFKAQQMRTRATHIESLSTTLPTTLESEIREYCELTVEDYADLTIATGAGRSVSVPIQENLISSTVRYRGGREFVSWMQSNGSVLPSLLARHRHVVLLGDPGGGKSTAVRGAVHEFALAQAEAGAAPVPFVITLRLFAKAVRLDGSAGFIAFLVENLASDHDQVISPASIRYLLHTGRAVVLFDGLDEIIDVDTRRQVVEKIEKFSRRFASSALVVTSREIGYDQAPIGHGFKHFVLDPFADEQIERFAVNVFAAVPRKDGVAPGDLLTEFMAESIAVRDLRSNPLLLGVLCLLYAASHTIPASRLQLYRRCAAMLFEVWDGERGIFVPLIDADAAEQAVREVALTIFESGEEEITESEIKEALVDFYRSSSQSLPPFRARAFAEDAFKAWTGRKWILTYAGEDQGESYYRFSHRTFLEYFAAEQVVYESESASQAWERIQDYAEAGAATPFCELVLQMMSIKTKGSADRMIEEAIARLDATDAPRRRPAALAVMSLLSGAVATLRVRSETRDLLFQTALDVLSRLVPWDSATNLHRLSEPTYLGYTSVFGSRAHEPDIDEDDPDDMEVNIDGASSILKGFMHLEADERKRMLSEAAKYVETQAKMDSLRWLRLAYAAIQIAHFEGWRSVPEYWREEVGRFAHQLWSNLLRSDPQVPLHDDALVDYWLVGALLREEAIATPDAVEALGWRGLLVGGWPFPVVDVSAVGTPAHQLALAAAGLERVDCIETWTDQEIQGLCDAVLELQQSEPAGIDGILALDSEKSRGGADQVFQRFDANVALQQRTSSANGIAEGQLQVAVDLLRIISELGDSAFISKVVDLAVETSPQASEGTLLRRLDAAGFLAEDDEAWARAREADPGATEQAEQADDDF